MLCHRDLAVVWPVRGYDPCHPVCGVDEWLHIRSAQLWRRQMVRLPLKPVGDSNQCARYWSYLPQIWQTLKARLKVVSLKSRIFSLGTRPPLPFHLIPIAPSFRREATCRRFLVHPMERECRHYFTRTWANARTVLGSGVKMIMFVLKPSTLFSKLIIFRLDVSISWLQVVSQPQGARFKPVK